jgi:hypothetical protein
MALTAITMTGASKDTIKEGFTAVNTIISDLAAITSGKGASCIGILDTAGNFTAANVETALAEVYTDHSAALSMSSLFDVNPVTTTGLTWGYMGGTFRSDNTITTIATGTVSLTDDTTNYIEVGSDGAVYVVASAFTSGRIPIRTVVTSGGVQGTSTDKRAWFSIWPTETPYHVNNLKVTVNATTNILDLFESTTGADPTATYPIKIAIPNGTGVTWRSRTASVLSGTGSFTLTDALGYWGFPSAASSDYEAYLYAIWSTADSALVWGLCERSDLQKVPFGLWSATDELAGDGAFAAETNWTYDATPWTYNAAAMNKDGAGTGTLAHNTFAAVVGQRYKLTYVISNWTVETVTPTLGGVAGTAVGANGTFTEYITATGTTGISFAGTTASRFTIDSITIYKEAQPYMMLEDSSTYTRVATDYCVAVAKARFEYHTADAPDYLWSASNISIIYGPYTDAVWQRTEQYVGSATRAMDAVSGDVAYTGFGFKPRIVEITATVDGLGHKHCHGAGTSGSAQYCMDLDAASQYRTHTNMIVRFEESAGKEQSAVIKRFDANGMTLTWTRTGATAAGTLTLFFKAYR